MVRQKLFPGHCEIWPLPMKRYVLRHGRRSGRSLSTKVQCIKLQRMQHRSLYAAPFLVAWLPEAQGEEKRSLVTFLALLARGNGYKRQHLKLTDEQRKQDPVFQLEMAEEIKWVDSSLALLGQL